MGQVRESALGRGLSSLLFGRDWTLMHVLNKHSLLSVPLIRLQRCISAEAAPAGMWMFSLWNFSGGLDRPGTFGVCQTVTARRPPVSKYVYKWASSGAPSHLPRHTPRPTFSQSPCLPSLPAVQAVLSSLKWLQVGGCRPGCNCKSLNLWPSVVFSHPQVLCSRSGFIKLELTPTSPFPSIHGLHPPLS